MSAFSSLALRSDDKNYATSDLKSLLLENVNHRLGELLDFPFFKYIVSDTDYFLDQRLIEEENMLAPSLKQFSLRVEILPSYIPVRVAEKILFVGESVQMFKNQNVNLTRKGKALLA